MKKKHPEQRIVGPESRPGSRCFRESNPAGGGKSGLRRIRCQVTPGGREPTESATESRPPKSLTGPARVKRCGKSAPRRWQHATARYTPPGARPNREAASVRKDGSSADPRALSGRPLEVHGDVDPRGMIALDRTRLTGRLSLYALKRGTPRGSRRTRTSENLAARRRAGDYLTTFSCGRRGPPSSVCGGPLGGSGPRSCSENTMPSPVSRA